MNRIKEPSTWAGLAALLQALRFVLPAYAPLIDGLSAAAGGAAVVLRERGNSNANTS